MDGTILNYLKSALLLQDLPDQIDFLRKDKLKVALLFALRNEPARAHEFFSTKEFLDLPENERISILSENKLYNFISNSFKRESNLGLVMFIESNISSFKENEEALDLIRSNIDKIFKEKGLSNKSLESLFQNKVISKSWIPDLKNLSEEDQSVLANFIITKLSEKEKIFSIADDSLKLKLLSLSKNDFIKYVCFLSEKALLSFISQPAFSNDDLVHLLSGGLDKKSLSPLVCLEIEKRVEIDRSLLLHQHIFSFLKEKSPLTYKKIISSLSKEQIEKLILTHEKIMSKKDKELAKSFIPFSSEEDCTNSKVFSRNLAQNFKDGILPSEKVRLHPGFLKIKKDFLKELVTLKAKHSEIMGFLENEQEIKENLGLDYLLEHFHELINIPSFSKKELSSLKQYLLSNLKIFDELDEDKVAFVLKSIEFSENEQKELCKIKSISENQSFKSSLSKEMIESFSRSNSNEKKIIALFSNKFPETKKESLIRSILKADKSNVGASSIIYNLESIPSSLIFVIFEHINKSDVPELGLALLQKLILSGLDKSLIPELRSFLIEKGTGLSFIREFCPPTSGEEIAIILKDSIKKESPTEIIADPLFFGHIKGYRAVDILNLSEGNELVFNKILSSGAILPEDILFWIDSKSEIMSCSLDVLDMNLPEQVKISLIEKSRRVYFGKSSTILQDLTDLTLFRTILKKLHTLDLPKLRELHLSEEKKSVIAENSKIIDLFLKKEPLTDEEYLFIFKSKKSADGSISRKEDAVITQMRTEILESSNYTLISEISSFLLETDQYFLSFFLQQKELEKIVSYFSPSALFVLLQKMALSHDLSEKEVLFFIAQSKKLVKIKLDSIVKPSAPIHSAILKANYISSNEKADFMSRLGLETEDIVSADFTEEYLSFLFSGAKDLELTLLSKEEKIIIKNKLIASDLNWEHFLKLLSLREVLGLEIEYLEKLIMNLSEESLISLARNTIKTNDRSMLFTFISESTKEKIISSMMESYIEELNDIDLFRVISFLKPNSKLRTSIIKNLRHPASVIKLLSAEGLTNLDVLNCLNVLTQKKREGLENILSSINKNYLDFFINTLIINGNYSIIESSTNGDLMSFDVYIFADKLFVIRMSEEKIEKIETNFKEFKISKPAFDKLKSELSVATFNYPKRIKGSLSVAERIFIPEEKELEVNISDIRADFSDASEILKGILRFTTVKSLPAVAIRKYKSNCPEYDVIVDLSDLKVSKKKKDFISDELKKRKTDISKDLDRLLKISPERKFGFELEISANKPKSSVARLMRTASKHKVSVSHDYGKSSGGSWDIKYDESVIAANGYSMEIASPILIGTPGISEAKSVLNKIFNGIDIVAGESVNGGLHIHHDIRDIIELDKTVSEVLQQFYPFQEALYQLCSNYRQSNQYCERLDLDRLSSDDYFLDNRDGFNVSSLGTIEFRMKESVSSTEPIIRWIKLTQAVVDAVCDSLNKKTSSFKKKATTIMTAFDKEMTIQAKDEIDQNELLDRLAKYQQARNFSLAMLGIS